MNLRPLGYEPSELPSCSTPRRLCNTMRPDGGEANRYASGHPVAVDVVLGAAVPLGAAVAVDVVCPRRFWAATARLMAFERSCWALS